jgi:hypothetical protein
MYLTQPVYASVKEMVDALNNKLFHHIVSDAMNFQYLEFIETPSGDHIKYMGVWIWYSEEWYWSNDIEDEVSAVVSVQQEVISQMRCIRDVVADSVEAITKGALNDE